MRFERWTRERLAGAPDDRDRALVRAYATWKVARDLVARVRRGGAGRSASALARSKIKRALELTSWLHDRELSLSELRQDLLDDWLAEGSSVRRRVGEFVTWLHRSRVIGPLEVARPAVKDPTVAATDRERLAGVARLLVDERLDLADRVAGCLVLLYAQPVARVARLRQEDVELHDRRVSMSFGREPAPLPAALGALVLRLRAERRGPAATAATERSPWLFAGSKLGAPIADSRLSERLRRVGVEPLRGRAGALAHLLHRVPAPVLADQIGMSPWTAQKWSYLVSPDYARYVARRHKQDTVALRR